MNFRVSLRRLAVFSAAFALSIPSRAQSQSPVFYYASGQKQVLKPSSRLVAVELEPGASASQVTRATANARVLARRNIVLLDAPQGKIGLAARVRKLAGVRRTLRVFDGPKAIIETNQFDVRFAAKLSRAQVDALLNGVGAVVIKPLKASPNGFLARLKDDKGTNAIAAANALRTQPGVLWAHPNLIWPKTLRLVPNDPLFGSQWHLRNTGQSSGTPGADAHVTGAWDTTLGSGVTVAIIDDGVDTSHEDLAGAVLPGYDFADNDADPRPRFDGGHFEPHGTSCAGVAVARANNGKGGAGAAPQAKLLPIRLIADGATQQDEADSFVWAADHGADVISCSWGPEDDGQRYPLPDVTREAIEYATTQGRGGKGCVIFWASGNGGESVELDGYASNPNVIAVGASTNLERRASYSDFGPSLDIVAPSNGGTLSITTIDVTGADGYSLNSYTGQFGGTSSASPLAAGVGALVVAVNPSLRWQQVRDILRNTADKIDTAGGAYDAGGQSVYYGAGRVNAERAVSMAQSANFVRLSGTIRNGDNSPAPGVGVQVFNQKGDLLASATTGSDGTYNLGTVERGFVRVQPQLSGSAFLPPLRQGTVSGDTASLNFTRQSVPVVTLVSPAQNVTVSGSAIPLSATTTNDADVQKMLFHAHYPDAGFARSPNKAIPDAVGATPSKITDAGSISARGVVSKAFVTVNIAHTYISDLDIFLLAPDGTRVPLWQNSGGDAQSLQRTFEVSTLAGQPLSGSWKLEISDEFEEDTGTLLSWSLKLETERVLIGSDTSPSGGQWTAAWNTTRFVPRDYVVSAAAIAYSGTPRDEHNVLVSGTKVGLSGRVTRANGSGFDSVKVRIAGGGATESGFTAADGTYRLSDLPSGTYTVTPSRPDSENVSFSPPSRTVTIGATPATGVDFRVAVPDSAPPQVSVLIPAQNGVYPRGSQASGSATDAASGVAEVRVLLYRYRDSTRPSGYWNGTTWTPTSSAANYLPAQFAGASWTFALPTPAQGFVKGRYALLARATDFAGFGANSDTHVFTIDPTPPVVSVTNPQASQSYPSLTTISGTANDDIGLSRVTVALYRYANGSTPAGYWAGGMTWQPTYNAAQHERPANGTTNWSLSLDTLAPGPYAARATAYDRAGNVKQSTTVKFSIGSGA